MIGIEEGGWESVAVSRSFKDEKQSAVDSRMTRQNKIYTCFANKNVQKRPIGFQFDNQL